MNRKRIGAVISVVCFGAAVVMLASASDLRRTAPSIGAETHFDEREILGSAGSRPQLEVSNRPWSGDRFVGFNDLTPEDASAIKRYPGFGVHPKLVSSLMGAKFPAVYGIPLAAIQSDIAELGYEPNSSEGLLAVFSVRLHSPDHVINYPNTSKLHIEFYKGSETRVVELDMVHDGDGRFIFESPDYALITAAQAIDSLGEIKSYDDRPHMAITRLSGIELSEQSIENVPPIGTLLIHHVYVGSLRILTGYQWAGRPSGIPGSQQPGFVR